MYCEDLSNFKRLVLVHLRHNGEIFREIRPLARRTIELIFKEQKAIRFENKMPPES